MAMQAFQPSTSELYSSRISSNLERYNNRAGRWERRNSGESVSTGSSSNRSSPPGGGGNPPGKLGSSPLSRSPGEKKMPILLPPSFFTRSRDGAPGTHTDGVVHSSPSLNNSAAVVDSSVARVDTAPEVPLAIPRRPQMEQSYSAKRKDVEGVGGPADHGGKVQASAGITNYCKQQPPTTTGFSMEHSAPGHFGSPYQLHNPGYVPGTQTATPHPVGPLGNVPTLPGAPTSAQPRRPLNVSYEKNNMKKTTVWDVTNMPSYALPPHVTMTAQRTLSTTGPSGPPPGFGPVPQYTPPALDTITSNRDPTTFIVDTITSNRGPAPSRATGTNTPPSSNSDEEKPSKRRGRRTRE